jgi:transcriptional regulator with XRE-family HTH domain
MERRARAEKFANELRGELKDRDWPGSGISELARRLNPENPDYARRSIHRWLNGQNYPQTAQRRQIAEALGLASDRFESEDDEEDEELSDLLFALDRFVHARIKRAHREREAVA